MSTAHDQTMPGGTTGGTPGILLAHHLEQLKLPTVLREYDKVARECAQGGIDHPRYLLRLVEPALPPHESKRKQLSWFTERRGVGQHSRAMPAEMGPAARRRHQDSVAPSANASRRTRTSLMLAVSLSLFIAERPSNRAPNDAVQDCVDLPACVRFTMT